MFWLLLAGVAGIVTYRRRRDSGPALACLLITGCAVAVLLGADLYEFSWRYQLPALVTLPVAGAFGVTALVPVVRAWRQRRLGARAGAAETAEATRPGAPAGVGGPAGHGVPAESADELAVAGSEQAAP